MSPERLSLSDAISIVVARAFVVLRARASWACGHLQQGLCALHGHNLLLRFEPQRLSVRCAACGWNSPGWIIAADPVSTFRRRVHTPIRTHQPPTTPHRRGAPACAHVA